MTDAVKAVALADRITVMAEEGVGNLDRTIAKWPAEFRAIIWDAVALIATQRARLARERT